MKMQNDEIMVLIPTLDEAKAIELVIDEHHNKYDQRANQFHKSLMQHFK